MTLEPPDHPDPRLLERLARLGVSLGVPDEQRRAHAARPDVVPIEAAVPGQALSGVRGACYVSDARFDPAHAHGNEILGAARHAPLAALKSLCRIDRAFVPDLTRMAFLDVETTGLSRDAGTFAFLIGAGRFEGEVFRVRQFFMRDPSEEPAQLEALVSWLGVDDDLVTFNGRAFDVPVLAGRLGFHRLPRVLDGRANLDLLPAARRLWRRRLGDCSLGSLERHVLGFARQDDIPGWMVPERYLTYQQTGDARPLVGVFRHNLFDVLSMVGLAVQLCRAFAAPGSVLRHGRDWLSLARAYETDGERQAVIDACESALSAGLTPDDSDDALRRLALAARRSGDWSRAVEVWETMASAAPPRRLFPFEELAKYYEHHSVPRQPGRALALAEAARARVEEGALRPARGRARSLADLDRRIARLRRGLEPKAT